jgi:hypothetical protein
VPPAFGPPAFGPPTFVPLTLASRDFSSITTLVLKWD